MGKTSAPKELSLLSTRARALANQLDTHSREYWRFFSAFVRCPRVVGAVAPSSRRLANTMIPPVDLTAADAVVELGAGTGVVTRALRSQIGAHTRLVALELRDPSAARLQRKFRDVQVVSGSAEHLRQHLDRLGHRHADCIVSGLPWGSMSGDLQRRILDAVEASLKPGGAFSAMAYVHASQFASARRFRRELERRFDQVCVSRIVWANLPPAFVYYCQ
ncbi:ribosomal RNA adenine dimethylase [mine drainage metagenome]|uniref:Ribosomal RNA adenine dimethylase n=1 Tax=mine drainage metagenome TaxID=410659 RepID=A0A1J5SML5_9ZZZZ